MVALSSGYPRRSRLRLDGAGARDARPDTAETTHRSSSAAERAEQGRSASFSAAETEAVDPVEDGVDEAGPDVSQRAGAFAPLAAKRASSRLADLDRLLRLPDAHIRCREPLSSPALAFECRPPQMYALFAAVPYAFSRVRGWDRESVGLIYIALLLGFMLGAFVRRRLFGLSQA